MLCKKLRSLGLKTRNLKQVKNLLENLCWAVMCVCERERRVGVCAWEKEVCVVCGVCVRERRVGVCLFLCLWGVCVHVFLCVCVCVCLCVARKRKSKSKKWKNIVFEIFQSLHNTIWRLSQQQTLHSLLAEAGLLRFRWLFYLFKTYFISPEISA